MNPKKEYPTIWLNEIEETTGNYSFSTDKNPEHYEYDAYSITDWFR
jgi:hypothetical protein